LTEEQLINLDAGVFQPEEVKLPPPQISESELVTPARRTTRMKTNSLPRGRKLRYTDDFVENSSDFEDQEHFRNLGEISEKSRVLVLYFLCLYKLETEEELRHEIKYVPSF
jgi:hypothetical protein